jgi:protocatechuate 3,4-dioxygenase beta subunit
MKYSVRLIALLLLTAAPFIQAQNNHAVEITPTGSSLHPVMVTPGVPVQFTARVFEYTANRIKVEIQAGSIQWSVTPSSLGSISAGGEFVAGPANANAISGSVIATVAVAGLSLTGQSAVRVDVTTSSDYTFSGTALGENNTPLHGANVSVMSVGMLPFMVNGQTDNNGDWSIRVPAGSYIVRAEASGYLPMYYDQETTPDQATRITTDPSQTTYDNIDFTLNRGGSVSGIVRDAATGLAIAGASIIVESATNTRPPSSAARHTQSGHDGSYTVGGLPDGEYVVMAHARDYRVQYYDGQRDRSNASVISIQQASQESGIDFSLEIQQPDPVFSISGTVRDANGNPIADAAITAQVANGMNRPLPHARSDHNGEYRIIVSAGSWLVHATAQGFIPRYYDNVRTIDLATAVVVDANVPSRAGVDFTLGTGGAIEGYVHDAATMQPIHGANVSILGSRNSSTPSASGSAVTDANGYYRIGGLAEGNYTVMARADVYRLQYYDNVSDLSLATAVAVTESQTTTDIDFMLQRMTSIRGTVTDRASNDPIRGAHIILDGSNTRVVAVTNAHGEYHLNVPPGSYHVKAEAFGYSALWYDDVNDLQSATPVVVTATGDATGIDFALIRHNASIAGIVRDASGDPIAGADVAVWINTPTRSNTGIAGMGKTQSAADGSYVIAGLAPGSYYIRASAAGYIPEFYDNAASVTAATLLTLAVNQAVTGIDFSLEAGGAISGVVTDANTSAPIAHAYVHVRGVQRNVEYGARTNAHGQYRIEGLPSGDYIVLFTASRYVSEYYDDVRDLSLAAVLTLNAPGELQNINAALEPASVGPRRFTGTVSAGYAVAALVEAIHPEHGTRIITTTDERGAFDFHAWDNAVIRARAIGHIGLYAGNTRNWKDSNPSGFAGGINFILEAIAESGLAEMSGSVRDASTGRPLSDAWLYATNDFGDTYFTVTGIDGAFRLSNLSNGELDLMVSEVRYEPTHGNAGVNEARGSAHLSAQPTGVTSAPPANAIAQGFVLEQNYPNPFNPATSIRFTLPTPSHSAIRVYDVLGRKIAMLLDTKLPAGTHSVQWDASGFPSGIYMYTLESNGVMLSKRMMLNR